MNRFDKIDNNHIYKDNTEKILQASNKPIRDCWILTSVIICEAIRTVHRMNLSNIIVKIDSQVVLYSIRQGFCAKRDF